MFGDADRIAVGDLGDRNPAVDRGLKIDVVGADAGGDMTALKKTSTWEQATYVEKGGWATMPGSKAADSGVSQACAAILSGSK
jgi:hypothetical protein